MSTIPLSTLFAEWRKDPEYVREYVKNLSSAFEPKMNADIDYVALRSLQ